MTNIWLILIFTYNTVSKQIFFYNHGFFEKELTFVFFPYDIIEVHVDEGISVFLTELEKDIYLDINAINWKGNVASYGSYKQSNKIAGVYFYNRKSVLKFTNYGNNYASLSIIFGKDDKFPDANISSHPYLYPAYASNDYARLGKPIIYDFNRNINGIVVLAVSVFLLFIFLSLFICYYCCCYKCCNK